MSVPRRAQRTGSTLSVSQSVRADASTRRHPSPSLSPSSRRPRAGTSVSPTPRTPTLGPCTPPPPQSPTSDVRSETSRAGGVNNVQVLVRVRPYTTEQMQKWRAARAAIERSEDPDSDQHPWFAQDQDEPRATLRLSPDGRTLTASNPDKPDDEHLHRVDHCFWSLGSTPQLSRAAGNRDVYEQAGAPVLDAALDGYNACIFAYGQTGSGKTHTMLGTAADPGLTRIIVGELFQRLARLRDGVVQHTVKIAFMEIYDEKVRDLLVPGADIQNFTARRVRDLGQEGVQVEDLRQVKVRSADEAILAMAEGSKARVVASTAMNATSSRSHAIFQIVVEAADPKSQVRRTAQMNLVDLAGSENLQQSKAQGQHAKEAIRINQSLSNLRLVFDRLLEAQKRGGGAQYIPYRDSVLTQVLRPALGGNSRTTMIATVSAWHDNYQATEGTLRYAVKARKITCTPTKNEKGSGALVSQYREELEALKSQLAQMEASTATSSLLGDERDRMRQEIEDEMAVKTEALQIAETKQVELEERTAELEKMLDEERRRQKKMERQHVADKFLSIAKRSRDMEERQALGRSLSDMRGQLEAKQNELCRAHSQIEELRHKAGGRHSSSPEGELEKCRRRCARLRRQRDEERYRWRVHASVSRALLRVVESLAGRYGPSGATEPADAASLLQTASELSALLAAADHGHTREVKMERVASVAESFLQSHAATPRDPHFGAAADSD
eukprot:TRINITY_DN2550_c0_g1_i1.p1 TRINITY_DN2550_c0_g1~~TRINITY_DN2550_c0_g1_i1.p1  ORF type:complete len:747 (+),score=227.25 TRINITY_DN2550_c0_g1_i1:60-2243(+)